MALPIVWRATARDELRKIIRYIASQNPNASKRINRLLESAVLPVAEHPYLYRQSQHQAGLREIVAHPNYIILYRVTSATIEVVNVIHSHREFP